MDKTRKAFVVLAAAVTAGGTGGCGSNSKSSDDPKKLDAAAAVDTKVPGDVVATPEAQGEDVVADPSQRDAAGADASVPEVTADTGQRDASGVDVSPPDGLVDLTAGEVTGLDGGAADTTKLDGVADTFAADVLVRMDASVASPETSGPLAMPAGTLYDVLTREQLSY